jgi:hypothetical protein
LIRIFRRKLHHHTSGRSDNLPGQENVLQSERVDLLPVFRRPYHVNLEQQVPNCHVSLTQQRGYLITVDSLTSQINNIFPQGNI